MAFMGYELSKAKDRCSWGKLLDPSDVDAAIRLGAKYAQAEAMLTQAKRCAAERDHAREFSYWVRRGKTLYKEMCGDVSSGAASDQVTDDEFDTRVAAIITSYDPKIDAAGKTDLPAQHHGFVMAPPGVYIKVQREMGALDRGVQSGSTIAHIPEKAEDEDDAGSDDFQHVSCASKQ